MLIIALTLCCIFSPAVSAELTGGDCRKAAENFLSYIGSDKDIISVKTLEKRPQNCGPDSVFLPVFFPLRALRLCEKPFETFYFR